MNIQGYFTAKGLALSAKLLSGETLEVTRVAAGSGHTDKPTSATALPQIQQELAVNTPTHSGSTAVIPATLAAAQARTSYTLTELGVYAMDPDEGEILYKVYQLSDAVDIVAGSRTVLRFYLEETISQDLNVTVVCSPAGLITEETFSPVREAALGAGIPSKTVVVSGADLPGYVASLPRLLTENLTIRVEGNVTEPLTLKGFYGRGFLRVWASSAGTCTVQNTVECSQCTCPLMLVDLVLEPPADWADNKNLLYANCCKSVALSNCTFTGGGGRAVCAENHSHLTLESCSISGFSTVMLMSSGAMASVNCAAAGDFHDNTVGAYVWNGGIVLLGGSTPDLLGGSANQKAGGIIVKKNGTLL